MNEFFNHVANDFFNDDEQGEEDPYQREQRNLRKSTWVSMPLTRYPPSKYVKCTKVVN